MDAPLGRKGVQLSKRGGNTCFVDALDGDPVTYCTYRVDIQYICMIGITGLAKSTMYYRGLPTGGQKLVLVVVVEFTKPVESTFFNPWKIINNRYAKEQLFGDCKVFIEQTLECEWWLQLK